MGKRLSWQGDKGLDWYLAMRSQGAAPTGGFGLGFERLVQYLVGFAYMLLCEMLMEMNIEVIHTIIQRNNSKKNIFW